MKKRIRVDLIFPENYDITEIREMLLKHFPKSEAIDGRTERIQSFVDVELCGHDEGKPCQKISRHDKEIEQRELGTT